MAPLGRHYGPDGRGAPKLFISSRCMNLLMEIPDYRWADLSPAAEDKRDQPEEPRKKDDHACDACATASCRGRARTARGPRPSSARTSDPATVARSLPV